MNRSTRTLVVVLVATAVAGIASWGVYAAVKSIPVREVEVAHAFIAVASRDLPNGSLLTEADVKLMPWPSANPLEGSFTRVEDVLARGLLAPVNTNEALLESKLAPLGAGGGLPPSIPTGMRAMSVKVDEVVNVAGYVLPGTRVDVIVTLRRPGQVSEEAMSRTVLSNVLVLTSGTKLEQDQSHEPQQATVVTLAVDPGQAEKLALATNEGKISLALRNPLDVAPTETDGVRVTGLMQGGGPPPAPEPRRAATAPRRPAPAPAPAPVAAAPAPPPPPSVHTGPTIRAATVGVETLEDVR